MFNIECLSFLFVLQRWISFSKIRFIERYKSISIHYNTTRLISNQSFFQDTMRKDSHFSLITRAEKLRKLWVIASDFYNLKISNLFLIFRMKILTLLQPFIGSHSDDRSELKAKLKKLLNQNRKPIFIPGHEQVKLELLQVLRASRYHPVNSWMKLKLASKRI